MLNTAAVIDVVLFGRDAYGAAPVPFIKQGATLVVMSSIPVETSKRHARTLKDAGVKYVDAPVSGGKSGAMAGRLTIIAGGDAAVVEGVRHVLETMGTVTHVGPVGMGQLTKLANQIIVGMTISAVAEALLLAKRGGADLRAVREALCGGFADSAVLRIHGERMQDEEFTPGAPAVYQLKDLQMAQSFANSLNMRLPLLSEVTKLFAEMCGTELAYLDHSALYTYLARATENKADLPTVDE
jgi:3-hydroxyisobutyrate dehydrogenase-like beta-hydroxyacid dehydrogenase